MKKSDEELINDVISNNSSSSFDKLIKRHYDKAYRIALNILKSPEDADEIAQDSFMKIYSAISSFRQESNFSTWMYRIVQNLAINRYNKKRRDIVKGIIVEQEEMQNYDMDCTIKESLGKSSPESDLVNNEINKKFLQEIDNLPECFREVFRLRNIECLSYKEIAEQLHCNIGTVKSRLFRAKIFLQSRL